MKPGSSERIKTALAALLLSAFVAWFFLPFALDRALVAERDAFSSLLPMKAYLARALREGFVPWWNPAPGLGKPFFAEWNTAVLYPPSALLAIAPLSRGVNAFFVFHFAATGVGALLFLRAIGAAPAAALLGAVVWTCGGPLVSLGHLVNHLAAIAWLPWALWAWERPVRLRAKVLCTAIAFAPMLATGSPEMAVLGALALLAWSRDWRAIAAPTLAAGLVAVQLVPTLAYLRDTYRGAHGLDPGRVLAYSATPGEVLELASPFAAPDPDRLLPQVYVGIVGVALAAVGWRAAGVRARWISAGLLVGLTVLALGSSTPAVPWLAAHLPLAALLRYPEKALLGVHALLALGAALGLSHLIAAAGASRRAALGAAALVAIAAVDLARANRGILYAPPPAELLSPPPAARAMARSDGAPIRYYANPVGGPLVETPAEAVRADRAILFGASGELFGLADVNTPASLNLVGHERLQRALGSVGRDRALDALAALGVRYATTWVPFDGSAVAERVELPDGLDGATPWGSDGPRARLYRLRDAADRAWLATRIERAGSADEATERFVGVEPGAHRGLAIVEEDLAGVAAAAAAGGAAASGAAGQGAAVRWVASSDAALALEVDAERPRLLVVGDTFAAGWTAELDGTPARILRVNGVVRGVALPGGRHRVEMRYSPPGLAAGLLASLVCLAGLAAAGAAELRRRGAAARATLPRSDAAPGDALAARSRSADLRAPRRGSPA